MGLRVQQPPKDPSKTFSEVLKHLVYKADELPYIGLAKTPSLKDPR